MTTIHQSALAHVKKNAPAGDVPAMLAALDDYGLNHEFLMNVGPEKGPLLQSKVSRLSPGARVLECGCFCGYSSILIGSALPENGTLIGVEVSGDSVEVARQMVEYADLSDRVEIVLGSSADVIPTLDGPLDLVFLDHWKDLYKPDLIALETNGLLNPGSIVFADNVGPHFNPEEYLDYVRTCGHYDSEYHESYIEYSEDIDGVEISVFTG
jgi:catechol O-methyltransferase